jgi:hypothetical protein
MTYDHRYPNPNNLYLLDFDFFRLHFYEPIRIGSEQVITSKAVLGGVRTEHPLLNQIIEFACFEK